MADRTIIREYEAGTTLADLSCKRCVYFSDHRMDFAKRGEFPHLGEMGECRRNPPTDTGWPKVLPSAACGEHLEHDGDA